MAGLAGFNAVLKSGATTIGKAKDVELDVTASELDTTTRMSGGWKEFIQGLKEWNITVDQLFIVSDAGLILLRDAFLNGTQIAVSMEDENDDGFSGTVIVTNMKFAQPLDGAIMLPVTLKGTGALVVEAAA